MHDIFQKRRLDVSVSFQTCSRPSPGNLCAWHCYLRLQKGSGDGDVQKATDDGGVERQLPPHCSVK